MCKKKLVKRAKNTQMIKCVLNISNVYGYLIAEKPVLWDPDSTKEDYSENSKKKLKDISNTDKETHE